MTTRNWLITGASSGFGRLMTERLLARGDRVTATLRRAGALDDLRAEHGDRLVVEALELADAAAVTRVVDEAFARMGRIDVVVSNAGYGLFGAAEELDDAAIVRQLDVNLLGSIRLIRAALPHLRAQGGGRVIQVTSEGGQIAYPGFSAYHASKWGIEGFVEAVAQEVAPFGIAFTLAEPGPARTGFGAGIVAAQALPAYAGTPADQVRRAIAEGSFVIKGDPGKFADAMIASADHTPAPPRLALGSTTYASIRAALQERLRVLEAQRQVAVEADIDG